jgi:hypothetical protein
LPFSIFFFASPTPTPLGDRNFESGLSSSGNVQLFSDRVHKRQSGKAFSSFQDSLTWIWYWNWFYFLASSSKSFISLKWCFKTWAWLIVFELKSMM